MDVRPLKSSPYQNHIANTPHISTSRLLFQLKLLLLRLLLLLPLGALLVGVNYKVDPANLFSGGAYERGVAALLSRGQNVTNLRNFDERLLQKCSIQMLPKRPPVLVLGSSRSMLIGTSLFPEGTLHNGAVSGGVLEDLLAVYQLYTARGWQPDTLIIGLDPWMFNANHGQERWKTLATEALVMRRALGAVADGAAEGEGLGGLVQTGSTAAKLSELVSLSYFQEAIKTMLDPSKRPSAYHAVATPINDEFTKHPDNSIAYDRKFRDQASDKEAKAYISLRPVYSLGAFNELSSDTRETLTKLVAHAQQKGTIVRLFLAPYHPIVWQFLQSRPEYQYVPRSETWCRELAEKQGIMLEGSFDPAPFGLTSVDFYDGMHCKPAVVESLLRRVKPVPTAAR
jgi:hypothetical protein